MTSLSRHMITALRKQLVVESAYYAPFNYSLNPTHCITHRVAPRWKLLMHLFFAPDGNIDIDQITLSHKTSAQNRNDFVRVEDTDAHTTFVWINVSLENTDGSDTAPLFTLKYLPCEKLTLTNLHEHLDNTTYEGIHAPHVLRNASLVHAPFFHTHVPNLIHAHHNYLALCHHIHSLPDSHATMAHFEGSGHTPSPAHNVFVFEDHVFPPALQTATQDLIRAFVTAPQWHGRQIFETDVVVSLHRVKLGGFSRTITGAGSKNMHDHSPSMLLFFTPPSVATPVLRAHHNDCAFPFADIPMLANSALFFEHQSDIFLQHAAPLSLLPGHTFGTLHYLCIHTRVHPDPDDTLSSQHVAVVPPLLPADNIPPRICYV
jgi:hypothetical protein